MFVQHSVGELRLIYVFLEFYKFVNDILKNQKEIHEKLDHVIGFFSSKTSSCGATPAVKASTIPDILSSICETKTDVMKLEENLVNNSQNREYLVRTLLVKNFLISMTCVGLSEKVF